MPSTWGAATGAAITLPAATTRLGAGVYHGVLATTPLVMEEAGWVGIPGMPLGAMAGAHEGRVRRAPIRIPARVTGRPPPANGGRDRNQRWRFSPSPISRLPVSSNSIQGFAGGSH
ncbi:hypothetical protein OQ789_13235 [Mycobacterium sp. 94-17]|nr:hypothetical protein [Mycobacterium sp. 94-17]